MEQIILNATERIKTSKKFREEGFIPGVIYGDNVEEAISVKFEELPLRKIITAHGSKVKLWVQLGDSKKFGFIKEVQKDPVINKIIHIDVQLVSKDHEIKAQVPIVFKGEDVLRTKQLQLTVQKSEVDILCKIALIPEVIHVDVSELNAGDTITLKDLNIDKEIKVHDKADETYASVNKQLEEEVEEEEVSADEPDAAVAEVAVEK